ncbi:MAG: bifunctional 5,10-methylenetetrahydrofolate dehydrogenase/5,10-methenyltetrahydrofolate cyclohydrolase [bacterium]|nr:bifunctional 5,10-methylenetetrahydrofolate dehydrogenase/5,10-methenyltetrahydrofolate cyclohydrolase [bacterium]
MKILNGAELRDFIKERQAKQVRALRQSWRVVPKLVIFYHSDSAVVETYMRLKKRYGEDILVEVEQRKVEIDTLKQEIQKANADESIHGIIVQLPLENNNGERVTGDDLDDILREIAPEKDVDGLNGGAFDPATAQAINWLLAGYNIDLSKKKIAIVGRGLLVGAPLYRMWQNSGYNVEIFGRDSADKLTEILPQYDVIVSATGVPELIKSEMLKNGAVVVDAGTAEQGGEIKGDLAESVRESRQDLTLTPKIGGVGPLTVAALIDNVIISARRVAQEKGQQDL